MVRIGFGTGDFVAGKLSGCDRIEALDALRGFTVGNCLDFKRMQFAERGDLIERQRGVVNQPYSRSFWHEQLLSHRYSPSVRPRRCRGRGINH
ncbi:hypothetical protein D3C78_1434390 [compost metagenome]